MESNKNTSMSMSNENDDMFDGMYHNFPGAYDDDLGGRMINSRCAVVMPVMAMMSMMNNNSGTKSSSMDGKNAGTMMEFRHFPCSMEPMGNMGVVCEMKMKPTNVTMLS